MVPLPRIGKLVYAAADAASNKVGLFEMQQKRGDPSTFEATCNGRYLARTMPAKERLKVDRERTAVEQRGSGLLFHLVVVPGGLRVNFAARDPVVVREDDDGEGGGGGGYDDDSFDTVLDVAELDVDVEPSVDARPSGQPAVAAAAAAAASASTATASPLDPFEAKIAHFSPKARGAWDRFHAALVADGGGTSDYYAWDFRTRKEERERLGFGKPDAGLKSALTQLFGDTF